MDYNRSGVPLIEIVSEPDMRSADEVIAYLEKLRMTIQYLGASDCKLNEGSMRADVNLSVREVGASEFGTRTAMNGFRRLRTANRSFRSKRQHATKKNLIFLPMIFLILRRARRWQICLSRRFHFGANPKKASNWLMGETMRLLKEKEMEPEDITFAPENLAKLIALADKGTINSTVAKEVFEVVFTENTDPEQYVKEHGLGTVSDEGALRETIEKIVEENPQSVADYQAGKKKSNWFLGWYQTMKAMQGKANPGMVNQILTEILDRK